MLRVRLITDPFDLATYTEHTPDALLPFLQEQFPTWPATARLYKGTIAQDADVTPTDEAGVEALTDDGDYYVVVYPADPVTAIIVAAAVFVVAAVALIMLMPKPPGIGNQGHQESSNNSIGNRVNKARPNERIPDIFGRIKTVPELLTHPLLIFEDNREFEICYMCVGRGEYEIDPDEVFDGKTPLALMAGAGADFYGPGTRPGNGAPFLEIGGDIGYPLRNIVRVNEVNGQKLKPPNANQLTGGGQVKLVGPASIIASPSSSIDFTKRFEPGDTLTLSNAQFGGIAVFNPTSQICRLYSNKRIQFETFDPATLYAAGQLLVIENGFFAGKDSAGNVVNVDISGTYTIASIDSATKSIYLD
jgi:hypothetical protein